MSFQTFQELPSHNLNVPEYRPMPVQPPPVFNTSETIAPLLQLAKYLSPEARALRKAAVAKANFEYRAYTSQNPGMILNPQLWWSQRQRFQLGQKRLEQMNRNNPNNLTPPNIRSARGIFGLSNNAYVPEAPDYSSISSPPNVSQSEIPDSPESSVTSESE